MIPRHMRPVLPDRTRCLPPLLGQDTDAVLRELGGSEASIAARRAARIV